MKKGEMILRKIVAIAMLLSLVACPSPKGDSADSGSSSVDTGSRLEGHSTAVVVTSDYAVYALATVDLDDGSVDDEITALTGDASVRYLEDDRLYVLNSYGYDTIQVYDVGKLSSPASEWSVGDGLANPHDVEFCGGELFVSLYGRDYVSIYDPHSTNLVGTVDLSSFDDGDGVPEASSLVKVAGKEGYLYLALQQLDQNNGWVANGGAVVEIDCAARAVSNSWDVGSNPKIYAHPTEPSALLVVTGVYYEADGGISVLDVVDGEHSALYVSEADIGVDIGPLAFDDLGNVVAIGSSISDYGASHTINCFDLESWDWTEAVNTSSFLIGNVANDRGEAWLLARTSWADAGSVGGIWVYDIATCSEPSTEARKSFSLDPYSLAFF